ncbi:MAG: hypothetical protein KDB65_09695 [Calditrichaeota bacterium]|nr:hypothetical protein [Calditrichota bacterium]MCB9369463.1 hypothetical protein [Calditrichota bacterium]
MSEQSVPSFFIVQVRDHLTRFYHLPPELPARSEDEVEAILNNGYDLNEGRGAMQWVLEHRPEYEHAQAYRRFLLKWDLYLDAKRAIGVHQFDLALMSLETILALDDEDPSAHYHEGVVYRYMYRFPDSETSLRRCLTLYPDCAIGHRALGFTLAYLDRKAEAIAELETALVGMPGDPDTLRALSEIRAH